MKLYGTELFGIGEEVDKKGDRFIYLADYNVGISPPRNDFFVGLKEFLADLPPEELHELLGLVKE